MYMAVYDKEPYLKCSRSVKWDLYCFFSIYTQVTLRYII